MIRIDLGGLDLNFNEMQEHVINTSIDALLRPLRKGIVPNDIPPKKANSYYGPIIKQLADMYSELTSQQKEVANHLGEYREILCNFKGENPKTFGNKLAEKLERITEGYKPQPGHGKLISPIEFFNNPMYHTTVQDGSGIPPTLGLKIKDE